MSQVTALSKFDDKIDTYIRSVIIDMRLDRDSISKMTISPTRAHYRAVLNWLSLFIPATSDHRLNRLRGLIEAYYHLCTIGDWHRARTIMFTHYVTDDLYIYWQLGIWGHYDVQLQICQSIVDHLEPSVHLIDCLFCMGDAHRCLGDYESAIVTHQRALEVSKNINNQRGETGALTHLGIAYSVQGRFDEAVECYNRSLTIAQASGDRYREAAALGNLTIAYKNLGRLQDALNCGLAGLEIDRENNNIDGQGSSLGNIGNVYHKLGSYELAINYHRQALNISRSLSNRQSEGLDLLNLGASQLRLALCNLNEALTLFNEIKFDQGIKQVEAALQTVNPTAFDL